MSALIKLIMFFFNVVKLNSMLCKLKNKLKKIKRDFCSSNELKSMTLIYKKCKIDNQNQLKTIKKQKLINQNKNKKCVITDDENVKTEIK